MVGMTIDVRIAGAGVAGLCVATELAARGARVSISDLHAGPGSHSCSWWAGGMLAPDCEGESRGGTGRAARAGIRQLVGGKDGCGEAQRHARAGAVPGMSENCGALRGGRSATRKSTHKASRHSNPTLGTGFDAACSFRARRTLHPAPRLPPSSSGSSRRASSSTRRARTGHSPRRERVPSRG